MTKKTLTANTPFGTFTRKTDSDYRFVTVWHSPRSQRAYQARTGNECGVTQRWIKDRGFAVTWHSKRPTPKGYVWDQAAVLGGIFEVVAL